MTERWRDMGPEPVPGHPTRGMHIWGWMSPTELEWLRATAATMESVVEVGSLRGRSAYALATGVLEDRNLNHWATPGVMYAIDPWNDEHLKSLPSFVEGCGNHFMNLVMVKAYSPAAARMVPDVDMVFIDGAHDEASVRADIEAWLPKTRRLICGHDYYDTDQWSVKLVVDEVFGDRVRPAIGDDPHYEQSAIWTVWL